MFNKVEICGVNTSKLITLPENQKRELLKKVKEGDKSAREAVIKTNLKLVLSVLQSFGGRTNCIDDLFQVGCIGLIKAVDNFDLSQNVMFSTYAVSLISGEIRRYLRDDSPIRISRSIRDTAYKVLKAKESFIKNNNREPTNEELSQILNIKETEITTALNAVMEPISLYEPVYSENGDNLYVMDQISDKINTDENWIENIAISESLKKLSQRERRILSLRFYSGKTQTEVSEEIGISQAQVSRLEKSAMEKIRNEL